MSDPEIFGPYAPVARPAALPDPATASAGEDARGGDSRAPTESRLSGPWAAVQAILRGATIVSPAVRVDLRGMPGYRSLVEERFYKGSRAGRIGPGEQQKERRAVRAEDACKPARTCPEFSNRDEQFSKGDHRGHRRNRLGRL